MRTFDNMLSVEYVSYTHQFILLVVLLLGSCDAIPAPGRVTTCLAQKFEVIVGHTACLAPSPYIIDKGVSQEDKERIVNLHNEYRGAVPAANMQKMVWDEELSEIVQKWTDNCEYHHDGNAARSVPGRFSVGQNLALGHADWASVIRAWNDEIKYFTYGSADNVFGEIGHFTQVVWAESSKVGCAYTVCENLVGMSFNGKYWACNYGPGGNSADTINTPYKLRQKDACEDCPDTCDALTGLCDCGGKVCQNGGTLDVNTCQCSCSKSFHEPEQCGVNCTAAMDPSYCQTQYNKEYCAVYANVPYDCPNMCDVCPYAGIDYTGPPPTSPPAIADVGETQSQGKQTNPAPTDPKPPEAVPTKKTGEETTPTEYDQEKSTTAPDGRQEGTTQEDDEVSGTPRTDPTVENVEPVTGTGSNEYRPVTIDYKDLSDQSGTWPPTTEEDEQQNIAPTTTEVPKPWGPKGDNMAVTFTVPFGLIISTYAVCLIF